MSGGLEFYLRARLYTQVRYHQLPVAVHSMLFNLFLPVPRQLVIFHGQLTLLLLLLGYRRRILVAFAALSDTMLQRGGHSDVLLDMDQLFSLICIGFLDDHDRVRVDWLGRQRLALHLDMEVATLQLESLF